MSSRLVPLALAIALAALFGLRAALPSAVQRALEYAVERETGLPLRIANVDLWLLRGGVALEGVVLGRPEQASPESEPDAEAALLRWNRAYAQVGWGDLLRRRVHLKSLALDAPVLRLRLDAHGHLDPLGTEQETPPTAAEPPPEPEPGAEASSRWSFALDSLELRGLDASITDAPGEVTGAEFALDSLTLSRVTYGDAGLAVGGFDLQGPKLRARRDFGFAPGAGAAPTPEHEAPEPGAPLAARVELIRIASAGFELAVGDSAVHAEFDLSASDLSAAPGHRFPVEFALRVGEGTLELDGTLGLVPPAYAGRLVWSDLPVPLLSLAVVPEIARWVRSCRASGDLEVVASLGAADAGSDETPGIRLSGHAAVSDLSLVDPQGEEVSLGWRDLRLELREGFAALDGSAARAELAQLTLEAPQLSYTIGTKAFETFRPSPQPGEDPVAAAPEATDAGSGAQPVIELALGSLEVADGALEVRDPTLRPPVRSRVTQLNVSARDLKWPQTAAKRFTLSAALPSPARPDPGSLSVRGWFAPGAGEVEAELERLDLPPLSPYAARSIGYEFEDGRASLKTTVTIRGERIAADNRLVLHDFAVSGQGTGVFSKAFGMPLDVAVALLRDLQGRISLPIPLTLERGRAKTGIARAVTSASRQAITGALTSPLKLAGALLPSGAEAALLEEGAALAPLEAVPGREELAPGQESRLKGIARLLRSRPSLSLALSGRAGEADRRGLAEALLSERVLADEPLPEVDSGLFARRRVRRALAERGRGEPGEISGDDAALLERYVGAVEVAPERFEDLAQRRARAARARIAAIAGSDFDAGRLVVREGGQASGPTGARVDLEFFAPPR